MSARGDDSRPADPAEPDQTGRITVIEVVGFTAVLGFVAVLALGLFDPMLTWR